MCGRYSLTTTIDQLLPRLKGPLPEGFIKHYQPRQQVRPGEPLLIQRQQQGRLEVGYALWGLVPSWLKDTRGKSRPINVRSETVSQKPFFRGPWRHHRCLLPADGFYEWRPPPEGEGHGPKGKKQPYWIRRQDGATYLASCLLDPAAKAQQPEHTDFSAPHWEWDDAGVKGTAARMEQLCVHALLAQLYAPELVQKGEVPPAAGAKGFGGRPAAGSAAGGAELHRPVWLGKNYQLQCQPAELPDHPAGSWQRGHWRPLSPLDEPMAAPLEWVEPVLFTG